MPSPPVSQAACTQATHAALKLDGNRWTALPLLGVTHLEADDFGPAVAIECRNCPACHSTLALEIAVVDELPVTWLEGEDVELAEVSARKFRLGNVRASNPHERLPSESRSHDRLSCGLLTQRDSMDGAARHLLAVRS